MTSTISREQGTRTPALPGVVAVAPVQRRRRVLAIELAALVLVCGIAVAQRASTLEQPLGEVHPFRQTQTAFQAQQFQRHGIDLLHPRVPVLDAPFELPYELPLYQAVATLPMNLGVARDPALRATNLATRRCEPPTSRSS